MSNCSAGNGQWPNARVRKFTGTDRNGLNYWNGPVFSCFVVIFTFETQLFYGKTYFVCPPA